MTTVYLIKNKDDYRSLMVDLAEEGCRWGSREEMTKVPYSEIYRAIYKRGKTVTHGREEYFMENYVGGALEEEYKIVHYTAKSENLFYTFQELLELDWDNDWTITLKYPEFNFSTKPHDLVRLLYEVIMNYNPKEIVRILKEGRFYLEKVE